MRLSALLLACVLEAPLAVDAAGHEGETVASLRIEGVDAARFEHYIEVRAGEPLRRSTLRHVVEVLYATGEFSDVVVLAEPTAEGLALVFRLVPTPRLTAVRVGGDRVVSRESVRKIARLVAREPLWPARLENAGREIALHLARDGYLEAQVAASAVPTASGADALFTVHAGPRARVASVSLEGLGGSGDAYRRLLPAQGSVFRRDVAERAAERIRKRLVAEGRWRAHADVLDVYDPVRAKVALTFSVAPGPVTTVVFEGAQVPAALEDRVESLLREGAMKGDVLEEATDLLEAELRARGHRDAAATHRERAAGPGRVAVVYDLRPGPEAHVASVRSVGASGFERLLQTKAATPLQDRILDEDARALTRALEEEGHADAAVEVEAPEGGGLVPVVFRARPGPRTLVRAFAVEAPEPLKGEEAPKELRTREGRPYRARDVALDRKDLVASYRNAGFLQAEVTPAVDFSEDKTEASVTLTVASGPRTRVDHIVVSGLVKTREQVVRRELLLKEGEPLGLQKVLESQRRLGALGIFQRVTLTEMDPESLEKRSLVVRAAEAPRTTVAYGIGYAERDFLRTSAEVTRRNLGGMDRSLSTFVRASFRGNRLLTTYREPHLFGRKQELFLTGFREEESREGFDFLRYGALVQTARPLSSRSTLILRYSYQQTNIFKLLIPLDEVDRQFRSSTVSGPSVSFVNDTRDDPLDPRRGRFLGADVQLSAKGLGGDSFVKGFVQAAAYRRTTPRTTLALASRVGLARTLGFGVPLRLPLPDRFFAGGDYSLRGYKIDTAGPLEPGIKPKTLIPTGGNALVLGSAELRIDVVRHFSVAAFSDAGNVFPLVSDFDPGRIRYTVGLGLRYRSALGPLRIDWGYKLKRRRLSTGVLEDPYRFHFTIGHAF
jgi:outer membrane protein assembly complex protein YaeT